MKSKMPTSRRRRARGCRLDWKAVSFTILILGMATTFAVLLIRHMPSQASSSISGRYSDSPSRISHANAASETTMLLTSSPMAIDRDILILVNWENPVPFDRPDNLIPLSEAFGDEVLLTNDEGSIHVEAAAAAQQMFFAAGDAGMCRYKLTSAYRSIEYQDTLWNARLEEDPEYGQNPFAEPVKVMPGRMSEHTTGLALDLLSENCEQADASYAQTPEAQWLEENAHRFGFILRYPEDKQHITGVIFEPWHYRYVGVDAAAQMYEQNLCLEEYLAQ